MSEQPRMTASERWPDLEEFSAEEQRAIGVFGLACGLMGCLIGFGFGLLMGWWAL